MTRALLSDFQLPNIGYAGCAVTCYVADATGLATAVKATLYDSLTGTGTLLNPQTFTSEGALPQPTYFDVPIVPVITGAHVASQTLGVICPPGGWRGDYAAGGTLYLPGDAFRNGAAGTNTSDVYLAVNLFLSTTWTADVANTAKMGKAIDYVALAATVVPFATRAQINSATASRAIPPDQFLTSKFDPTGKQHMPVVAAAMQSATTNGAAPGVVETTTNKVLYRTLDFDTTTQEFAGFSLPMPKSWNESTVTFRARWTAASGSGGVAWALQGLAVSDGDAIDQAYGTEQVVTDTLLTAGALHITAESSAVTIGGTPAEADSVMFRVKRVPANASDTLGVDARLTAIDLFITTDAGNDA